MNARYAKFDNIKFFLILLVVIGHVCGNFLNNSHFAKSVYAITYSFHMPAFLYISGLFSKKAINNRKWTNAGKYILMFFLIEVVNTFIQMILGESQSVSIFMADGIQWFALCLFFSYLITIMLQNYNLIFIFVLSIIIGCISGYDGSLGNNFASSRTIVFYPFFFAGFMTPVDKLIIILEKRITKIISLAFIVSICVVGFSKWAYQYFWQLAILEGGSMNYGSFLGDFASNGIIYRVVLYMVSFVMLFSVIALIPNKDGLFAKLGSRSMQVYILHIGAIYIYCHFVLNRLSEVRTSYVVISLLYGILITFLFSSRLLEKLFNIILSEKKN